MYEVSATDVCSTRLGLHSPFVERKIEQRVPHAATVLIYTPE